MAKHLHGKQATLVRFQEEAPWRYGETASLYSLEVGFWGQYPVPSQKRHYGEKGSHLVFSPKFGVRAPVVLPSEYDVMATCQFSKLSLRVRFPLLAHMKKISITDQLRELEDIKIPWWEEYILWPLERIKDWPVGKIREIKWFIQRGRRGWSEEDMWSLDNYLSYIISESLGELAKTSCCYPADKRFPNRKEWKKWLKEMSYTFNEYIKLDNHDLIEQPDDPTNKQMEEIWKQEEKEVKRIKKKMHELIDCWEYLWD